MFKKSILKNNMVDGRYFENVKCDISAVVQPILMKFGTAMHIRPPNLAVNQKFKKNSKFMIADGGHLENQKSWYLQNRLADYDEILHDETY